MTRFHKTRRIVAASLGVLTILLMTVVASSRPASAAPPAQAGPNVTIVGPLPLPVTGSTTVSGTAAVRDVDNAARSPFQAQLCQKVEFGTGTISACSTSNSFEVPSDERLVIEYVSGTCFVTLGVVNSVRISMGTTAGGSQAEHRFLLTPDALDARNLDAAQQTRIYADPSSVVGMNFSSGAGPGNGVAKCTLTLSGYTVTP